MYIHRVELKDTNDLLSWGMAYIRVMGEY